MLNNDVFTMGIHCYNGHTITTSSLEAKYHRSQLQDALVSRLEAEEL